MTRPGSPKNYFLLFLSGTQRSSIRLLLPDLREIPTRGNRVKLFCKKITTLEVTLLKIIVN